MTDRNSSSPPIEPSQQVLPPAERTEPTVQLPRGKALWVALLTAAAIALAVLAGWLFSYYL